MFTDWPDLIAHQKNVRNLSTEQLGAECGVSRATAFRWASGVVPVWFETARTLFFGGLVSVVERWGEYAGTAGTLDLRIALDGSGVRVEHAGVVVAEGETLAQALEAAAAFLDANE